MWNFYIQPIWPSKFLNYDKPVLKSPKLCMVIPSLLVGGMERVMSELANYFCAKDYIEVHLILYGIKRDVFYPLPQNIVIHKPDFVFNNSFRIWNTFRTILWLRKKLKSLQPTAVLSFGELWNNFVLLATLGLKLPVFVSDRCQPDKSLGKFHDKLRIWLYPKAVGVICQTQMAKEIYSNMFHHNNFVVIGNPIRNIEPNPEIQKENIILSVGRLIKSKHHDELIRIFESINPPDWKLVIVGDDALKQKNKSKLEQLVKDLGMERKIELVGKRSDIDDFYNRAKIFAFTSSSEGFPNVVGEAMSAGLPVVAYDCVAGPDDLIEEEKTGFLIPLHDQYTFGGRLQELMLNADLRDLQGEAGKERIKEFAVEKIGKRFEEALLNENTSN